MSRTVIRNGTIVDPSQGLHGRMDMALRNGVVEDIAPEVRPESGDKVFDVQGLYIAPGFIDLHTHLREPGGESAETIESGCRAAAAGGFTTIYCMPNTRPVCDTETGVHYVVSRAARAGCVRVIPVAAVTKGQQGEEITNMGRLQRAGAGAFSDDGYPVMNAEIMRRALEYTSMIGVPVMEHCEDANLSGSGAVHEGAVSLKLGLRGIPRVSESTMVSRNVALAAATGGHIHICHVSARESVEAIREAKRNGVHVTAEVTPHHLTMTDKDVLGYNVNAKMKPPLCEEEDREALIAALEDGTIDCIATDHAPHSANAKDNVFDEAPFGIIGMESAFPLLFTEFVLPGRWPLEFLVEKLTVAPAAVVNRPWGTLQPGSPADMAILQLGQPYTFERRHLHSRSSNCPWLGRTMKGRVAMTLVGGLPVYESPDLYGKPQSVEKPGRKSTSTKTPKRKTGKSNKATTR